MEFDIRPMELKDAKGLNNLRRMKGVFENVLGIPSEKLLKTEKSIESWDENCHDFAAIINENSQEELLIGAGGLHIYKNPRKRHCAGIGIMVHKEYQGKGVGSKLMKNIIDIADNWLMLKRLELTVYSENKKAINLYKKFGFVEEGVQKKSNIRNGKYVDTVMMARLKDY